MQHLPWSIRTASIVCSSLVLACSAVDAPHTELSFAQSATVSSQDPAVSAAPVPTLASAPPPPPERPSYAPYANGRFEPVVTYAELAPNDPDRECTHWVLGFEGIAAYPGGTWLVGSCGVRVRVDGAKVERFPTPVENRQVMADSECTTHIQHWSIAARSRTEAWILGSPRCYADPNAVWPNTLERFDGKVWRKAYSNFGVASGKFTGGDAFEVFIAPDGTVFTELSDTSPGSDLQNSVGRFSNGRFTLVREGLDARVLAFGEAARKNPNGPYPELPDTYDSESYSDMVPLSSTELFVFGALTTNRRTEDATSRGGILTLSKGAWTKEELDERWLGPGARAPSGVLWTAGEHLWRRRPGGSFERVLQNIASKQSLGVSDLVVRGEDDLFMVITCEAGPPCVGAQVLHYDGTTVREVEVIPAAGVDDRSMTAARPNLAVSSKGEVWLQGEGVLWRLAAGGG